MPEPIFLETNEITQALARLGLDSDFRMVVELMRARLAHFDDENRTERDEVLMRQTQGRCQELEYLTSLCERARTERRLREERALHQVKEPSKAF